MPPDRGASLLGLIRGSVADPQDTARLVLARRPPRGTLFEALILVSILGALLSALSWGGVIAIPTPDGGTFEVGPILYALGLAMSLLLTASGIQVAGRILGGQGGFDDSLALVVWIEVVALVVQAVQVVAALLLPPLAPVVGLVGLAILVWCFLHFTRVLHGFDGYGRTFAALLLAAALIGISLSLLLALVLGFTVAPDV